jgi:toxin ParE1/3/4
VAAARYSSGAEADLENIVEYTLRTWGEAQVVHYLTAIEDCCEKLAENPMLGRSCEEIRAGLRRMEAGRHVIFYHQRANGIRVSRILHRSMAPESRLMDDDT